MEQERRKEREEEEALEQARIALAGPRPAPRAPQAPQASMAVKPELTEAAPGSESHTCPSTK